MAYPHRLTRDNRLALLMHGAVTRPMGKMGFGLMRYSPAPIAAVIDRENAGHDLSRLTGIRCDAPIVDSVKQALAYAPDVLVPAVAPPGGALPEEWWAEVCEAVASGLSLVNGLHRPLADDRDLTPRLKPGRFIWDVRVEPPDLNNGMGRAREVPARRVLLVGTDMACGKMSAALELDRAARERGIRSKFLASGQIGVVLSGDGICIDAVRTDFATGAVEQMVLSSGFDHEVLFVEGQGSLLHPASTATLALLRGAMPTHLVLAHRAGQDSIARAEWVRIPPLRDVIALYEQTASAAGALPECRIAGIALNTGHLGDDDARRVVDEVAVETGLPTQDVVRFGADDLLDAIVALPG